MGTNTHRGRALEYPATWALPESMRWLARSMAGRLKPLANVPRRILHCGPIEPSLHLQPPHTSEELPASACSWKRPGLADEMQVDAEDRPWNRRRCRRCRAQENK